VLEDFTKAVAILTELGPLKFESDLLRRCKGRPISFM
jgi:hypothetical protein